jgi:hypothetical protein
MATLNLNRPKSILKTHEGAQASHIKPIEQLSRSVMSCLLWEREFYEDGMSIADRIRDLVLKCEPEAVAALAIQARSEMNLRHIPLLMVREMARHKSHRPFVAKTLEAVIQRADELSEFLSIYWMGGKEPLAKCVQKGLAKAFVKFNEYSLAKYNREKAITLRDVLFLSHAKPKDDAQAALWKRLIADELAVPDTWEVELSKSTDKTESWFRLLKEDKLGALALLRNLRNMTEAKINDKEIRAAIGRADVSRVLPFRFIAAARYAPRMEPDLEAALFRNLSGLPKMKGETVVLVDISGSMDDNLSGKSDMKRTDAACGLAMIAREICESVRIFSFSNLLVEVAPRRGFALRDAILTSQGHGGTALGAAVAASPKADRLIVITDEQSADNVGNPSGLGYMINVASAKNGIGYGKWLHLDGFSEAVIRYIMEHEKKDT